MFLTFEDRPLAPGLATSGRALAAAETVAKGAEAGPRLSATTKLLFVTSEMGDFLKSGGLGEVSAALPRHLRAHCDARVLIPGYRALRKLHPAIDVVGRMPGHGALPPWSLGRLTTADGLPVYVILCDELFDREGSPYGPHSGHDFSDNDLRFARLSLAAAELAAGEADPNWRPDILHVNDWPSAMAPGYLRWKGLETPSILTIHNLAYQGLFDPERLGALGVPDQAFSAEGAEFHGKLGFLKAGIHYASHVTTVSESYAREITMPEHGCGLDGLLRRRQEEGRLTGIVNGIDESWSAQSIEWGADGRDLSRWKRRHAAEIRRDFGLAPTHGPLFSIVSRLVHQKGVDLSLSAAQAIVANGGQLVVTGRGDLRIEEAVSKLAARHPTMVAARIGFDDREARALFAASDFLLMPSRFEPCGLSQMYAQKSGSLPIAHRTGGLIDTIEDGTSGFLFSNLTAIGLGEAVARGFRAFRSRRSFSRMRRYATTKSFGWSGPARLYARLYAATLPV